MKSVKTEKNVRYTFGDLLIGDWFKDEENTLYIKVDEAYTEEGTFNAIKVADGSTKWFYGEANVGRYIGTITINADMFDIYNPVISY